MKITRLFNMSGSTYKSKAQIMNELDMGKRSVDERIAEIMDEIRSGRYSDYAVIRDGGFTWVNWLVWIDYETYRKRLKEKNLRKNVPPFNPYKLAYELGMYQDKEVMMI